MQPDWQIYRYLGTSLSVRRSPEIKWYLPWLSQYSSEPKTHSFVYHSWIHKYRIHLHGVCVRRSCRQRERFLSDLSSHIAWLHRLPCSPKLFNGFGEKVLSSSTELIVVFQGGVALPTLKSRYRIALNRHPNEYRSNAHEMGCLIVPSGRFCLSNNYILIIPRGYMQ